VNQPLNRQNPQETPSLEEKILSNLDSPSSPEGPHGKRSLMGFPCLKFTISNF